jgi:alpha-L-fucosidase
LLNKFRLKIQGEHSMHFRAELESIREHKVPGWYEDAKFGIFIHWGLYSVPAWAPPTGELGSIPPEVWFTHNPYAEWYFNSIRVKEGPSWEHHKETYGEDFPYENFIGMWHAEKWNPREWASLFREAGAQYVVPVTKHHDGFCLWDSAYTGYNSCRLGPRRDIVSELCRAVRDEGMRFGVYYSGLIDWRWAKWPMRNGFDVDHPDNIGYDYADYAYNQVIELINAYKPSLIFNDIGWPYKGEGDLPYLFAHYYNTVEEGVVDDRWNGIWSDYATKEYHQGEDKGGLAKKWEECRGIGLSFGYNQVEGEEHLLSPRALVRLVVQTVAANGNLLINVGPRADGVIPEQQAERLRYLGAWLGRNGEAIYGTRPHNLPRQELPGGQTVFFTRKEGTVYLLVDGVKPGTSSFRVKGVGPKDARALCDEPVSFGGGEGELEINLSNVPPDSPVLVFAVRG